MQRPQTIWIVLCVAGALWLAYRGVTIGAGAAYVQEIDGAAVAATPTDAALGIAEFSRSHTIGLWLSAFFTLAIFSFMYRDNPVYKFAEATVIGVSAAYWMVIGFWTTIMPNLLGKLIPAWTQSWAMPGTVPIREDDWWTYIVPLVLGLMLLWRLAPKWGWIGRWPLALIIGSFAGLRLVRYLHADFMSQISNSLVPLIMRENGEIDWADSIRNTVGIISVLACLVYFFFSVPHKGRGPRVARRCVGADDHVRCSLRLHGDGTDRIAGDPAGVFVR
jgi:hypothetical protein